MHRSEFFFRAKRAAIYLLFILCSAILLLPVSARAKSAGKTVRVGWYQSSFNTRDRSGRRTGYAYDYQLKIAAYTGWTYRYVSGSWPELLEMLENGEIDLLSDVSYTEEREKQMLFPSLPMGAEEYFVFEAPGSGKISRTDPSSLKGKKIGVNKGSVQVDLFRKWMKDNGTSAEIIEISCSEKESLEMLHSGGIDGYVTVDSFVEPELAEPVFKIGSSDFFFAVNKERPDLAEELDEALSRIQDEDRFYNRKLFEKYIKGTGANAFLTPEEIGWLDAHGAVRVGYQDDNMAFCAADEETGELTGVLKDFLDYGSDCMANAHIDFTATAYPTVSAALDAMKRGEVDCVFPVSMAGYDGEKDGVIITPPLADAEIYAVVSAGNQSVFAVKEHVITAVNEGNPNYDEFLLSYYPEWRKVYFPTTEECLESVSRGVTDCFMTSSYRINSISRLCEREHLTTIATGVVSNYCFAAENGETELYSILARLVAMVPDTAVNSAFSYYIAEDSRLTPEELIEDNLAAVMALLLAVVVIILFLLIQNIRAKRSAKRLIAATETDELTHLYNRSFFFQYANRMYREHPEKPMDAFVLNIEQFHSVNALNGRNFGDRVLRALGDEIRAVSKEYGGIGGRFEADRFDIYCHHTDAGEYQKIFDRLQGALDSLAPNTSVRLRMGVMPWQEKMEPVQLFDRARMACTMARGSSERLIVFDEKMRDREMYEQRLLNDLRRALDEYEFEVYYQPQYDIQSVQPGLAGAEALVRWRHPELGMIPPDNFISLFEKNGRIMDLDRFVWEEAAGQVVCWREKYGVTIPVSVNISRVDVFDPGLESTLEGILRYHGLEHDALRLEVTESAYTENADQVIRVVESLRRKGFEVEMDDFGTGYSSLHMLSSMPVDVLKMDRGFIRNIGHNEKDVLLVALILEIAGNLKIPVVAEGVETEEQLQLLKKLGCDLVQGYYFSRPLHPSDFEALLSRKTS